MSVNADSLFGIIAILLWSTTVAIVRGISSKIDAAQAGATAFSISAVLCVMYLVIVKEFDSALDHPVKYLLICGLLFVVYTVALFLAIDRAKDNQQAMELGLINYLWPSLTVLLSLVLTGQQASILLLPGILCAFFGVFVVISQGERFSWNAFGTNLRSNLAAYLAALIAAVSWATYSNLTNLWANPDATSAVFIFIPITGLAFFLLAVLSKQRVQPLHALERKTRNEILFLGLSTVLSYLFWDISMRRGNVSLVAILSYFTPFFSTLVVSFYHKESFTRKLWVGCLLIIIGSLLSWISIG